MLQAPAVEKDTLLAKNEIPIIDVSFGTEELPVRSVVNRVAVQLAKALENKGMALLVNHGISEEKLKTGYSHLDDFCKLPEDTKELYLRDGTTGNHGYVKPGQERFDGNTKDIRHAYNICTLNLKLPEEPLPGFREHIAELAKDFKRLTGLILQALAVALEMPLNFFVDKHSHMLDGEGENETTFRLLYYPPVIVDDEQNEYFSKGSSTYSHQKMSFDESKLGSLDLKDDELEETRINKTDVNKSVTRCGEHCDYGTFTLLVQDSEGGLEVQLPGSEKWRRIGHLPGAVFINAGELLSIWTQGKYPALRHRVVIPENSVARTKGRHSIAYFVHPDNLTPIIPIEVGPPPSTTGDTSGTKPKTRKQSFKEAKLKIYNAYQHVQRRFKETYAS
ncbi:CLUMA_CG003213, isoform A [Clunio marinus]|uniref:CLUMA_CG003213, isoform A n=1 Tax=Clunio marinus TaxID=568069 RepID=A0A1J1HNE7_9DIPT|nr:CLUMA_CG003213, isoform A [Clunio marinus]